MRMIASLMCVGSILVAVWSELQRPRKQPAEAPRLDVPGRVHAPGQPYIRSEFT